MLNRALRVPPCPSSPPSLFCFYSLSCTNAPLMLISTCIISYYSPIKTTSIFGIDVPFKIADILKNIHIAREFKCWIIRSKSTVVILLGNGGCLTRLSPIPGCQNFLSLTLQRGNFLCGGRTSVKRWNAASPRFSYCTEAEFMNVQFRWGFQGIILRGLRLEVSVYYVYLTNQFQTPGPGEGGGGESFSRGDCEKQGGKLLRLLSQLRPRIRPLCSVSSTLEIEVSPRLSLPLRSLPQRLKARGTVLIGVLQSLSRRERNDLYRDGSCKGNAVPASQLRTTVSTSWWNIAFTLRHQSPHKSRQVSTLVYVMPLLWSHTMEKHLGALAVATVLVPANPSISSSCSVGLADLAG
jgi:hypothetical protein